MGVDCIRLDQVRDKCQAVSERVLYRRFPKFAGNFFTS